MAMKCVDALWLWMGNTKVASLWGLWNVKVICSWMTVPCIQRYYGENLIPDNVFCQWGHIQTTQALLYKGQFLLIWMTLVLCSEQRLCDFYLLWCKIKRIVNRFHWCSSCFFSPLHLFNLGYSTMVSTILSKLKKGSPMSQRWHLNCCWADKNNMPPSINGALWTHPQITLSVCGCESTRQ